jgi:starch phosphorylase
VVSAEVALGDLAPADVRVEIVHGPLGQSEEIAPGTVTPMVVFADGVGGHRHYRGQIDLLASGHYGLTVRVVPDHADLVTPIEVGHVTWAS